MPAAFDWFGHGTFREYILRACIGTFRGTAVGCWMFRGSTGSIGSFGWRVDRGGSLELRAVYIVV
eukprot:570310-Prymnesium_polylepis.1